MEESRSGGDGGGQGVDPAVKEENNATFAAASSGDIAEPPIPRWSRGPLTTDRRTRQQAENKAEAEWAKLRVQEQLSKSNPNMSLVLSSTKRYAPIDEDYDGNRKRRKPLNPVTERVDIPSTYEECGEVDKMLIDWHAAGASWPELTAEYIRLTGARPGCDSALPSRIRRMKTKFARMPDEHAMILMEAKVHIDALWEQEQWVRIAREVRNKTGTDYMEDDLKINYKRLMELGVRPAVEIRKVLRGEMDMYDDEEDGDHGDDEGGAVESAGKVQSGTKRITAGKENVVTRETGDREDEVDGEGFAVEEVGAGEEGSIDVVQGGGHDQHENDTPGGGQRYITRKLVNDVEGRGRKVNYAESDTSNDSEDDSDEDSWKADDD